MNLFQKLRQYSVTDKIAIEYNNKTVTYNDFFDYVIKFSCFIKQNYSHSKDPIVIYGHKNEHILPCMLGCILAGNPYVPIDITLPLSRLKKVLHLVNPKIIVNLSGTTLDNSITTTDSIVLDEQNIYNIFNNPDYFEDDYNDFNSIPLDQICYILFTSGSTGEPKGVMINWENLCNFTNIFTPIHIDSKQDCKVLNCIPYSFDLSVGYIYPSLYSGHTLYSLDKTVTDNLKDLFDKFSESNLNIIITTPSFIEMCCSSIKFNSSLLPLVNKFIFCGETLQNTLAIKLMERFPESYIINTYGPTEATVLVTEQVITYEMAINTDPLTIGKPLPDMLLKIVDESGNEVEDDIRGQIQIIGKSVGCGYYNNEVATKKVFFINKETGYRGYNTGDLGFKRNGLFYFCHRMDSQIKLNGNRIELGDIESNLTKLLDISSAVVMPIYKDDRISYLVAFIILKESTQLTSLKLTTKLKKELGQLVPAYMIPQKFIVKDAFPLNSNGKIDRKALLNILE